MIDQKELALIFKGYQDTSKLWKDKAICNLEQFPYDISTAAVYKKPDQKRPLRIGKWVEKFVQFQLEESEATSNIHTEIQIRINKLTIGELDALFFWNDKPVHLEIVYKFYLYDPNRSPLNPLDNWVGPNRKDRLALKLDKLKSQQLPLIHNGHSRETLIKKGFPLDQLKQYVLFKAKLFTPYNQNYVMNTLLNSACKSGEYLPYTKMEQLRRCRFYIPIKVEWLKTPSVHVNWMSYNQAQLSIAEFISKKRSPLVWTLDSEGTLKSFFITWW